MADEGNELPAIEIVVAGRSESRHAAQAVAVLDGVVELAIGLLLCILLAHVGRPRIHRLA